MATLTMLAPMLSVGDGAKAIAFYERAFGAVVHSRTDLGGGKILAELAIDGAPVFVSDEAPEHRNLSPERANGTTVRMHLVVGDPDAVAALAIAAGAQWIFPMADHDYGWRQGRIVDPFGHQWLIGRPLG